MSDLRDKITHVKRLQELVEAGHEDHCGQLVPLEARGACSCVLPSYVKQLRLAAGLLAPLLLAAAEKLARAHQTQFEDSGWCAVCDCHHHPEDCLVRELLGDGVNDT